MKHPILGADRIEALGPALLDLRRSQKRSRDSVALGLSTSATHLSQWELGRKFPTCRSLFPLLEAYGYQVVLMHRDDFHTLLNGSTRSRGYLDDPEDDDA